MRSVPPSRTRLHICIQSWDLNASLTKVTRALALQAARDNSYVGTFGAAGWGYKAQETLGQVRNLTHC